MKPSELWAVKAREESQVFVEQGRQLLQENRLAEAQAKFEAALVRHPQNIDAMQLLGIVYLQTGHPQLGVSCFKKVLVLDPRNATAHYNLAQAQDDLQQFDEAIANFDRALAINPNYSLAIQGRKDTLARQQAAAVRSQKMA